MSIQSLDGSRSRDFLSTLLLNDKDMTVFIRQALNGKPKETHIREIYDGIVRKIS